MPIDYLHNHPQFSELIRIVAGEKNIDPALVEKDYWIMHCLYGLRQLGLTFEMKGGTSLSNPDIAKNEAFILSAPETRNLYDEAYTISSALYCGDRPTLEQIMAEINAWADRR